MSSAKAGRRGFFKWLSREGIAAVDELRGIPQLRLSDLSELPDAALEQLAPRVAEGIEILPGDQDVRARVPGRERELLLFPRRDPELFVFNRCNGQNSLGAIGRELSAAMGWPEPRGFAAAKALFLRLARLRVCVPGNFVR